MNDRVSTSNLKIDREKNYEINSIRKVIRKVVNVVKGLIKGYSMFLALLNIVVTGCCFLPLLFISFSSPLNEEEGQTSLSDIKSLQNSADKYGRSRGPQLHSSNLSPPVYFPSLPLSPIPSLERYVNAQKSLPCGLHSFALFCRLGKVVGLIPKSQDRGSIVSG